MRAGSQFHGDRNTSSLSLVLSSRRFFVGLYASTPGPAMTVRQPHRPVIFTPVPHSSAFLIFLVLVTTGGDDIVDFEDHTAELRGKVQLLAFPDQRVYAPVFAHI